MRWLSNNTLKDILLLYVYFDVYNPIRDYIALTENRTGIDKAYPSYITLPPLHVWTHWQEKIFKPTSIFLDILKKLRLSPSIVISLLFF